MRDRTKEFQQLVTVKQRQQVPSSNGQSQHERPSHEDPTSTAYSRSNGSSTISGSTTPHQQSEFAKRASSIGLGIHSTSQKLQKLTQLAKRTSMFDDPAQEINELATMVKQDIHALNQGITDLQTFLGGSGNKQSADHSNNVVETLRNRLKDTTKEFKDVLTLRTDNLKVHEERKSLFVSSKSQTQMFPQPGASFLPQSTRHSHGDQQQQQQQSQMLHTQQDTYLTSRQDALQDVESTIVELGNIFQQLSHMVHEQGEMAVRIDENIDETFTQVEAGQAQLLKYLNTISGNRWLMLKVFGLIVACLMFFLLFIA
jgi:syntaxin 5